MAETKAHFEFSGIFHFSRRIWWIQKVSRSGFINNLSLYIYLWI